MEDIGLIDSCLVLPNGAVIPNRLVKAAMEEGIGYGGGLPDERHRRLYTKWGEGGWGIIISGNVQVDPRQLATPHDRFISNSRASIQAHTEVHRAIIAAAPKNARPLTLMQISHAGLQSSPSIGLCRWPWERAIAPCSSRPDMGDSLLGQIVGCLVWPRTSRAITDPNEWLDIVNKFVEAAKVAEKAGWNGVQVHSAHGYLLAEYLSPSTNPSPISLPGVPTHIPLRLHLLYLILSRIHAETPRSFVKSVKINCSDFVQGGVDEAQAADIVKEIVSWKLVDILEISGGNYSNPAFADLTDIANSPRQSLFAHFTTSLLPHLPSPPEGPAIMLTGGLHSRPLIASSIRERACDLAGIGRPACVRPTLPRDVMLNRDVDDDQTGVGGYTIPRGDYWKNALGGGSSSTSKAGRAPSVATYMETEDEKGGMTVSRPTPRSDSKNTPKPPDIPMIGAGVSTFWHEWQLCKLARGVEPDLNMSWGWGGVIVEMLWWGIIWNGLIFGLWRRWKEGSGARTG